MDILDIFYNYVIKEAMNGSINCFIRYCIAFNTYIFEDNEKYISNINIPNVIIPTLTIKNKQRFNELLIRYVNLCLNFYDNNNYLQEVIVKEDFDQTRNSKEKLIMSLLWSNATYDDFEHPEEYLLRRIAFLENYTEKKVSFNSEILNGNVSVKVVKDNIHNETPFKLVSSIENEGDIYYLPEVKFGICDDTVYFYAIQKKDNGVTNYNKKINRLLYKVGEGFDSLEDNYSIYEEGNLKDISAPFLVALNIAINYFNSLGYDKFNASSILISRWNAKKIIVHLKNKANLLKDGEESKLLEEQDIIQKNITDKFLRTFLRLSHHYPSIEVTSYPFDTDSYLHLNISGKLISNNTLLNDLGSKINNGNNLKI